MTKVYLAARYSRHPEMRGYADELEALGYEVTSRWINGVHEKIDGIATHEQSADFATDDLVDLCAASIVINFTEDPTAGVPGRSRGGRHVEFGMALAMEYDHNLVVGFRENVFHHLPSVTFFETWSECLGHMKALAGRGERSWEVGR